MTDQEKKLILEAHDMSEDELETVAGGVKIDWPADCQSTVEDGSSCFSSDACYAVDVQYLRDKDKYGCSATVEDNHGYCSTNDYCDMVQIRYKSYVVKNCFGEVL